MALTRIVPTAFEPKYFSVETREKLERLLDRIDAAVAARGDLFADADEDAFMHGLDHIDTIKPSLDHMAMIATRPQERRDENFAKMAQSFEPELRARLEKLDADQRLRLEAFCSDKVETFVDPARLRQLNQRLSALYGQVVRDFPGLVLSPENEADAVRLARVFRRQTTAPGMNYGALGLPVWRDLIRDILAQAFPDDDVASMQIVTPTDIKTLGGQYDAAEDTLLLVCDKDDSNNANWHLNIVAHEFQHRRQHRLVDRFKKGELEPGSADHYRARLYKANLGNGYLSFFQAPGGSRARLAAKIDYKAQPVEVNAEETALLACARISREYLNIRRAIMEYSHQREQGAKRIDDLLAGFRSMLKPPFVLAQRKLPPVEPRDSLPPPPPKI